MWLKTPLDLIAIAAQLSGALIWPILQAVQWLKGTHEMEHSWTLPLGLLLSSCGWWESFVNEDDSSFRFVRWMGEVRMRMIEGTRYFTYMLLSLWKVLLFFLGAWLIVSVNEIILDPFNLFTK